VGAGMADRSTDWWLWVVGPLLSRAPSGVGWLGGLGKTRLEAYKVSTVVEPLNRIPGEARLSASSTR
jgi:hypothetical protein